jgi:hypothetical protein
VAPKKKRKAAKAKKPHRPTILFAAVRVQSGRAGAKYRAYCNEGDLSGAVHATEKAAIGDAAAHQALPGKATHTVGVEMV